MDLWIIIISSYLLGSMLTGVIVGKITKNVDIRKQGSGNSGATNTFRVLGWKAGVFVLAVDILKGVIPVAVFAKISLTGNYYHFSMEAIQILAGFSAIIGHVWSVFGKFKGGKGVATTAGVILGLFPVATLICIVVFILTVWKYKFVSLGSMLASVFLPLSVISLHYGFNLQPLSNEYVVLILSVPALVFYTHRTNIRRLLSGTENRFSFKRSN